MENKETLEVTCPSCEGRGKEVVYMPWDWLGYKAVEENCWDCYGSGTVTEEKAMELKHSAKAEGFSHTPQNGQ